MKRTNLCLIAAAGICMMMLGSCKEKKKTDDIITTKYVPKQLVDPIRMTAETLHDTVQWKGGRYLIDIQRTPADSLAMVSDEDGQKYVDNYITLAIRQPGGGVFFKKTLSKAAFMSYLDEVFRKNGILSSIRFSQIEGGKMVFSAVVALPDAVDDLFMPMKMYVDSQGNVSIERDNDMGMRQDDALSQEDEYEGV